MKRDSLPHVLASSTHFSCFSESSSTPVMNPTMYVGDPGGRDASLVSASVRVSTSPTYSSKIVPCFAELMTASPVPRCSVITLLVCTKERLVIIWLAQCSPLMHLLHSIRASRLIQPLLQAVTSVSTQQLQACGFDPPSGCFHLMRACLIFLLIGLYPNNIVRIFLKRAEIWPSRPSTSL